MVVNVDAGFLDERGVLSPFAGKSDRRPLAPGGAGCFSGDTVGIH
jgi:hypothetical protein